MQHFQPVTGIRNPLPAAVISSTCNPVSAKQKLSPLRSRGLLPLRLVLLVFLAALPSCSHADSLEDAAQNLARKICTAPRQQSVKINWQVSPELSGALSDSLKKMFISQLSACGMATDNNAEFPLLNIAIRVTASKLLLVANLVDSGGSRQVRMTEIRRDAFSVSNSSSETPRLQRKLLWQQESPLESAMEWYGPSNQEHFLFLVGQGSIVRLRSTNEVWTRVDSAELPKADRPSRFGGSTFMYGKAEPEAKLELLLNRKLCAFAPAGSFSLICNDSHLGGKQLRMSSECGGTPSWSLWTDTGDYAQRDRIFCASPEVAETSLSADEATSRSVEMPGPVLDISTTVDFMAAIAVVRNLSTGNYEVYRITVACAN
jgi:hypothetical protein